MSYRVTNSMMMRVQVSDMHRNMDNMMKQMEQISTQRKYNRPSENPVAVTRSMGIDTSLVENQQYQDNLRDALSWLKFSDQAMTNITTIFQRMRELTIQAGNGALTGVDTSAIAKELTELREELRVASNASMGGRYLFGGLATGESPFGIGPNGQVTYNGNDYNMFWEFERFQTGQVSTTGRDVYPLDKISNTLQGIELPLDFVWQGRDEIMEFKVGNRSAKVRIPERWQDEFVDDVADPGDYNRFRDPKEKLQGYSLKEIADIINNSTEMGDSGRLVSAKVVVDNVRGVQRLEITSHTGEPVRLTSWPETDAVPLSQGIQGAAFGPVGRTASADGQVGIRFNDQLFYVDVKKGDTLTDIAEKLRKVEGGRIWASVQVDNSTTPPTEWLNIVSRKPGETFTLETTGGATSLFAPQATKVNAVFDQGDYIVDSFGFGNTFSAVSPGQIELKIGGVTHKIDIAAGDSITDIETAINALGAGITASVGADGELSLSSPTAFSLSATGGALPLFNRGVTLPSGTRATTEKVPQNFALGGEGALAFQYNGQQYWLDLAGASSLQDVANAINGLAPTLAGSNLKAELKTGVNPDGTQIQWLEITSDKPVGISGYGVGADVLGRHITGSNPIQKNTDHSHIDFARFMGIETALRSTEVAPTKRWDTTQPGSAVHLKFVSGTQRGEVFINDAANLSMQELADRIRGVCGDWMDVVLETDMPDGTNPADPLNNSGDNKEGATQRLVLRTKNGDPVAVYDGPGKQTSTGTVTAGQYAAELGLNTAIVGNTTAAGGIINYPSDGTGPFDENMPAILEVQVGGRAYTVKICANRTPTAESVAASIVSQVNAQYGGNLLSVDNLNIDPTNPNLGNFALFSTTGEPIRILDRPYGDPRFGEFTGGITSQLGIQAGLRSTTTVPDTQTATTDGVIRIQTPGRTIDVPVLAGESLQDIAGRIREQAGAWLDVSFSDSDINDSGLGGTVQLSLAAKDGSAVSVSDIVGRNANAFGLDTGLVGATDMTSWVPQLGETLTLTVNGVEHTIDLWDDNVPGGRPTVWNVEGLVDMINTRFQGQDIRAEVLLTKDAAGNVTGKRLALMSPKGFTIGVDTSNLNINPGLDPANAANTNVTSPNRGGTGPFNQQVTVRTAPDQEKVDFFGVVDNLISAVAAEDRDGISNTLLGQMDDWFATLLRTHAQVGALTNRYETAQNRLVLNKTSLTELNDEIIGVDLAEASMNYNMMSSVYQASLAMIAKAIQPTLLDFLR